MFENFPVIVLVIIVLIVCLSMHHALNDLRDKVFQLRQSMEKHFGDSAMRPDAPQQHTAAPAQRQAETPSAPLPGRPQPAASAAADLKAGPAPARMAEPAIVPATPDPDKQSGNIPAPTHPAAATPPPVRQTPPRPRQHPAKNIEKYIGTQLFAAIGIGVLILGVGFFIQYAINNDWLNETMRTVVGFLCGFVLLGIAARLRNTYRRFSSVLAGGAFAVTYVTVAIAYHYYALFPQAVAFGLLVLGTLLTTAIAAGYDRRELAVVALTGGFVAPFLASDSHGSHVALFLYIAILHAGMFVLALRKKWWELPVISFAATYLIFCLFVRHAFSGQTAGAAPDPAMARDLFLFAALFYLIFTASAAAVLRARNSRFRWILAGTVALNNFFFLRFGLLFLHTMAPLRNLDGLVPLAIAAVNTGALLAVRSRLAEAPGLKRLLLSLAVLFLTLAAPLQFGAERSLLCWAAEIVLLLWFYARTRQPVYEIAAGLLALPAFNMTCSLWFRIRCGAEPAIFRSSEFLTSLCMAAAFVYAAWFTGRKREIFVRARLLRYPVGNVCLILAAGLLVYGTFLADIVRHFQGDAFVQSWLLCTVAVIAAMLGALRRRFPIAEHSWIFIAGASLATGAFLLLSTPDTRQSLPVALSWISTAVVALTLAGVAFDFYRQVDDARRRSSFLVWFNLAATSVWIATFCHLLTLLGIYRNFSTGFSLALISAASLQMGLGMHRRQRGLRIFALAGFAVVLAKLLLRDLWQWPTLGRIVVFIALGIILLSVSFLYQRLKSALFKDDEVLHTDEK